jgi:hypothetical protein
MRHCHCASLGSGMKYNGCVTNQGIAVAGGTVINYILIPTSNRTLLFSGMGAIIIALIFNSLVSKEKEKFNAEMEDLDGL